MDEYQTITLEIQDGVATVTLNRPQVLNAFNELQREETRQALRRLGQEISVGAVILKGAGDRAFSAGQDLNESQTFSHDDTAGWVKSWVSLYEHILDLPVPVIAAIDGYAVGAGLQTALACDLRLATKRSKLGMPEINIGIPCITGTAMMWPVTSLAVIKDLVLTGRFISGEEAYRVGLVTHVVDTEEFTEATDKLAQELAEQPRTAVRMNKLFWRELTAEVLAHAQDFGARAHGDAFDTGEAGARMRAFTNKE